MSGQYRAAADTGKSDKRSKFLANAPPDAPPPSLGPPNTTFTSPPSLLSEAWTSAELVFSSRLTYLLICAPPALLGSATGVLSEPTCFALAGLALIPCAERLSFVTEHVAAHTNGTIGALLNATFGNAPEFLISSAALRAGFYRVVQLALLGSVLTNLLMVFGLSCLVGGLRWQVQELRAVSGSVAVGMLLLGTAGIMLPAVLIMTGQVSADGLGEDAGTVPEDKWEASADELGFSRFNSLVMVGMYLLYLTFQLGTHREEFSDTEEQHVAYLERLADDGDTHGVGGWRRLKARRNLFCKRSLGGVPNHSRRLSKYVPEGLGWDSDSGADHDMEKGWARKKWQREAGSLPTGELSHNGPDGSENDEEQSMPQDILLRSGRGRAHCRQEPHRSLYSMVSTVQQRHSSARKGGSRGIDHGCKTLPPHSGSSQFVSLHLSHASDSSQAPVVGVADANPLRERSSLLLSSKDHGSDRDLSSDFSCSGDDSDSHGRGGLGEHLMSFRCGIAWLLLVTVCISAVSDVIVETIDEFAYRYGMSEVFTSVVILPFFSNIAEQVSAVLFAYRNEMDLCVGVTVGSAVQIVNFVMPGCVLVGWAFDRSLSLYFRGYETCCLLAGVLCVSAVLQGGTTNWLVGAFLVGAYLMVAAGFWFHEVEDLSVDAEEVFRNMTLTETKATFVHGSGDVS